MKAIIRRGIFLFILLLPSLALAYTETIYVCQGGRGSAVNAGTCSGAYDDSALASSGAWSSSVSADGKIGPGDLVLFMDDGGAFTSNMDTKANGRAGQPITFSVAPGDTVTWRPSSGNAINIRHQYITIDGNNKNLTIHHSGSGGTTQIIDAASSSTNEADYFTLKDTILIGPGPGSVYNSECLLMDDDNFTITGNEISHCVTGIIFRSDTTGEQQGLISNNYIHHMDAPIAGDQWTGQDCILLKGQDSNINYMNYGGVVVSHNHLSYFIDDGIDMFGAYGVTFEYNEVGPADGSGHSGIECNGIKMAGAVTGTGDGTIVRYNYVHDFTGTCDGSAITSNGNGGGSTGMFVYGNLVENIQKNGINLDANEQRGVEGNMKIYNNTVINVDGYAVSINRNDIEGTEVYNNILDGGSADLRTSSSNNKNATGGCNILVNDRGPVGSHYTEDGGCPDLDNTDPLLNADFTLQADSPAIDAGTHLNNSSVKALLPESAWPNDVVVVEPQFDGTRGEIGAYAYIYNAEPLKGEGVFTNIKKD